MTSGTLNLAIRAFTSTDWPDVREIYEQGILTRSATFETVVPDLESWTKKFHADLLWVALAGGKVIGWAGLQPVSIRDAYKGVAEVTIYIHQNAKGTGVGTAMIKKLAFLRSSMSLLSSSLHS